MADRPIIFSAPMVRALLAGRKTQTRRLLSPRPSLARPDRFQLVGTDRRTGRAAWEAWAGDRPCNAFPAGQGCCTCTFSTAAPGDRLYVREAWSHTADGVFEISEARIMGRGGVIYRADDNPRYPHAKFWPSLHMPREFSRLTLIVEEVRVEPLQAITLGDICAEGLAGSIYDFKPVQRGFDAWIALWSSLHTKPGERWEDNPMVVALTFRVEQRNIDAKDIAA